MRVFIFKTGGLGDQYGIGSYIKNITGISKLHKARINYFVIDLVLTNKIQKIETSVKDNITYCKIPTLHNGIMMFNDALLPNTVYCILKDIFDIKENDIFHFNSGVQYNIAHKIKEELSASIIYTMHISLWRSYFSKFSDFLKKFNSKDEDKNLSHIYFEKKLCRLSDKVICLNSESVKYVTDVYKVSKRNVVNIPNGLPKVDTIANSEQIRTVKNRLGLKGYKVILYVGRVSSEKGVFDLVESFVETRREVKKIKLVIVGDGAISHAATLAEGAWADIIFTGYIKDKKLLKDIYSIADVIVNTSYHEQSSYSFLEAIQSKKAIVLSNIPAFEEMGKLSSRKIGFKKNVKNDTLTLNKKQLSSELKYLLTDSRIANTIAQNAHEIFNEKFLIDKIFDKMLTDVYGLKTC